MRILPLALLLACDPAATDTADTGDGGGGLQPGDVVVGAACPLTDRVGRIGLMRQGASAYLDGQVFASPSPWYGAPALTTPTCEHHVFDAGACGVCDEGLTCGQSGECVALPEAFTDLEVDVTVDGQTQTFQGDAEQGMVFGDAGPAEGSFALTVRFGGQSVEVPAQALPVAELQLSITIEGDSMAPGALDASWTPAAAGSVVRTTIPINHHAAGPTFTSCAADASAGAFHADAEMIDPLAVVTGLEFQGVDHGVVVAAQTEVGCVELFYGGRVPHQLVEGGG